MKSRSIIIKCIFILACHNLFSQTNVNKNYFQIAAYSDVSTEFLYLHYVRIAFQHYLNDRFSIQTSLKVGSRSVKRWYIPYERDGIPINWINWHTDNPSGNPFVFAENIEQPEKLGITSYQIDDESMFYSNFVISCGYRLPIFSRLDIEFLAGAGLRYTDYHSIGEAGDGIFQYNEMEYLLYYLVPVYQRGIDGHFNFEMNLNTPLSERLSLGASLNNDWTFGSMEIGVGNYISAGISLKVKL